MGIYYVHEDQCHNTLMKISMTVSNADSYRPPVSSSLMKLPNSTMDSNKRPPRFGCCHVSSLQTLHRGLDDSRHTEPFTSTTVSLLVFKMLCETFDLHHRSVLNSCLVQVHLLLIKIQYFITFFPSHSNS